MSVQNNRLILGGSTFDNVRQNGQKEGIAIESGFAAEAKLKLGLATKVTMTIDGEKKTLVINNMSARKWLARTTITPNGGQAVHASRFGKGRVANNAISQAIASSNKSLGAILTRHVQAADAKIESNFETADAVTQLFNSELDFFQAAQEDRRLANRARKNANLEAQEARHAERRTTAARLARNEATSRQAQAEVEARIAQQVAEAHIAQQARVAAQPAPRMTYAQVAAKPMPKMTYAQAAAKPVPVAEVPAEVRIAQKVAKARIAQQARAQAEVEAKKVEQEAIAAEEQRILNKQLAKQKANKAKKANKKASKLAEKANYLSRNATIIQAAFRGYQARKTANALRDEVIEKRAVDRENALNSKPYLADVISFDHTDLMPTQTQKFDQFVSGYLADISTEMAKRPHLSFEQIDDQMSHAMADEVNHEFAGTGLQYSALNAEYNMQKAFTEQVLAPVRKAAVEKRLSKSNATEVSQEDAQARREAFSNLRVSNLQARHARLEAARLQHNRASLKKAFVGAEAVRTALTDAQAQRQAILDLKVSKLRDHLAKLDETRPAYRARKALQLALGWEARRFDKTTLKHVPDALAMKQVTQINAYAADIAEELSKAPYELQVPIHELISAIVAKAKGAANPVEFMQTQLTAIQDVVSAFSKEAAREKEENIQNQALLADYASYLNDMESTPKKTTLESTFEPDDILRAGKRRTAKEAPTSWNIPTASTVANSVKKFFKLYPYDKNRNPVIEL